MRKITGWQEGSSEGKRDRKSLSRSGGVAVLPNSKESQDSCLPVWLHSSLPHTLVNKHRSHRRLLHTAPTDTMSYLNPIMALAEAENRVAVFRHVAKKTTEKDIADILLWENFEM